MSEEPLITQDQLRIMRHALGIEQTGREYRNRYCPGPDAAADCEMLEVLGYMQGHELDWIPGRVYCVTEAGKRRLA